MKSHFILKNIYIQADTDVFRSSYDQTRRHHVVSKKTSDLRGLENVWFTSSWKRRTYDVLKTSGLKRLQDVSFTTPWRYLIYVVLKTSSLRPLDDVWFTTSSGRLVYDILRTSDLCRFEDVELTISWRRLIYNIFRTSGLRRLEDVQFGTSWKRDLQRLPDLWFTRPRRRPVWVVLKMFNLRRLEYVWFTTSWKRLICDVLKTSVKRHLCGNVVAASIQRRKKLFFLILYCLKYSENFNFFSLGKYLVIEVCTNQWTGLYMIWTSVMKQLTALNPLVPDVH